MKTAITKEIHGKTIIIGFSDPVIDPVETEKKIIPLLDDTEEVRKIKTKAKEIGDRQRMGIIAMKEHARFLVMGKVQQSNAKKNEAAEHFNKVTVLMVENKPNIIAFKNIKKKFVKEHAEYFQPKIGEVFIEDEQYQKLVKKEIGEFGKLTLAGKVIPDYSGQSIYQKTGVKWIIINLDFGDKFPDGAILVRNLTDEQKIEIADQTEIDRISELSGPEKETEKQNAIDGIAYQAAKMRSALEIQGDGKALVKSQDWYNAELVIIEAKYK